MWICSSNLLELRTLAFLCVFQAIEKYDMSEKHKCLEPYDIAKAVVFAASQPEYAAINEILVEPRDAPLWKYFGMDWRSLPEYSQFSARRYFLTVSSTKNVLSV